MVKLRLMVDHEYECFADYSFRDYFRENCLSGLLRSGATEEKAGKAFAALLPDGLDTEGHFLFVVERGENDVGALWFGIVEEAGVCEGFVFDIVIYPQFRRRGYARKAFQALERQVLEMEIRSISLNVYVRNLAAVKMYEGLGFEPDSLTMRKFL